MEHYVGIGVSLELSSVRVVDAKGAIIREAKVTSEPDALVSFLRGRGHSIERVGLEAGPLSQWLHAGLTEAGFETALLESLADVMILRAPPAYVRSDNGPEFIALALREGIAAVGAKTVCIEPGSLWESGDCESFNSKLRDELLNGEVFFSLAKAQVPIEAWRRHDNAIRPRSSLGYRQPAPESYVPNSGNIAPWASAPAVGAARSPTPTMASELAVR